jgi:hypothetical protein
MDQERIDGRPGDWNGEHGWNKPSPFCEGDSETDRARPGYSDKDEDQERSEPTAYGQVIREAADSRDQTGQQGEPASTCSRCAQCRDDHWGRCQPCRPPYGMHGVAHSEQRPRKRRKAVASKRFAVDPLLHHAPQRRLIVAIGYFLAAPQ